MKIIHFLYLFYNIGLIEPKLSMFWDGLDYSFNTNLFFSGWEMPGPKTTWPTVRIGYP